MVELLRELLHREPFSPFRIMLTCGEGFDVSNPDLVAMGQTVIYVLAPKSDKFAILRLNQIASLQSAEPAA
jgi:hypothetical protein